MKKRKYYRGELGKPINLPIYEKNKTQQSDDSLKIAIETTSKLGILLKHYGIDKNDNNRWFMLALNLAATHVPGFGIEHEKKTGRPKEWDETKLAKLYLDVEELKRELAENGYSTQITNVCRTMARKEPYKEYTGKTLSNQYYNSKNSPLTKLLLEIDSESFQALMFSIIQNKY